MLSDIISNEALIIPIGSWAVAQTLKVIITLVRKRKLDLRLFVGSGGMPSSHSAVVTALATTLALTDGLGSVTFAISAILALVVISDAVGVRRSVGQQSTALNRILSELRLHRPMAALGRDLRELIGHTPFQALAGSCLGILVAWLWLALAGAL